MDEANKTYKILNNTVNYGYNSAEQMGTSNTEGPRFRITSSTMPLSLVNYA